ncbi:MAG: hypothetical protein FWH07_03530 [Oscillospiraceae bacterium]|nr:hypothetical protein [Oscillospiraceae bacterium]
MNADFREQYKKENDMIEPNRAFVEELIAELKQHNCNKRRRMLRITTIASSAAAICLIVIGAIIAFNSGDMALPGTGKNLMSSQSRQYAAEDDSGVLADEDAEENDYDEGFIVDSEGEMRTIVVEDAAPASAFGGGGYIDDNLEGGPEYRADDIDDYVHESRHNLEPRGNENFSDTHDYVTGVATVAPSRYNIELGGTVWNVPAHPLAEAMCKIIEGIFKAVQEHD